MREIVHIQTGQCGNQIGAKVSVIPVVDLGEIRMPASVLLSCLRAFLSGPTSHD